MARQAPIPVDVQDFQFKLNCRLKVFANEDNAVFDKPCNLLANASRFGLIFVGTTSPAFQVIQTSTVEKHTVKEGEITDYNHRVVSLPSLPKHLSVNCDNTRLAVVVEKIGCATVLIYDIASFMKQDVLMFMEIRLSPTPGVNVTETSWNPAIPNIFTACKNDGTLGLYELKETGIDINELPAESQACCMCWSPKGKQIAVGSRDGRITQYKPDLKAAKVVNAPPLEEPHSVITLQWISSYQFIALYKPLNTDGGASLLVVDSPRAGDTVYTNYEDICYSYGNLRPMEFYMIHQATWNILMVASANSMEVGVLGSENEQWTQWILADAARAELPLSIAKQETLPIGFAFDTSSVEPVLWGETSLPPVPFLLLLSHHGLLCCFRAINIKSGVMICHPPEMLADTSGLSQFTNLSSIVSTKPSVNEPQKQNLVSVPPTKPVAISMQATLPPSTQLFTTPQLPQVPLFTTPPTSLFGAQQAQQQTFQVAKSEPISVFKPDVSQPSLFSTKSVPQNLFASATLQHTTTPPSITSTAPVIKPAPVVNAVVTAASVPESNIVQEEADLLISKLIREECETLEAELKTLLQKARSVKVNLGTDSEAVELVHGTDAFEEFLKEVTETSSAQNAEVHSLKQGLIQTWAWYEDARSRFAQTQDATLEALLRIQQLDPVSQRYLADIQHMTYYMESQLLQASRALDEQWENFQDSCKKIIRLKIPTMEAIYQTMVRQSIVHQKQKYILKDISSRIRSHRSKISGPSLFVSLNNADQLENELRRLQLEPQHLLQAQYERVLQNQQRLTKSKIQKLSKLLFERDVTRVTVSKPQLSSSSIQTLIQSNMNVSEQTKNSSESSVLLGAALSPICLNKPTVSRMPELIQSTPKIITSKIIPEQKQAVETTSSRGLSGLSMKFTPASGSIMTSTVPSTSSIIIKPKTPPTNMPLQFKFSTIPSSSSLTSPQATASNMSAEKLNFNFTQFSTPSKISAPNLSSSTAVNQINQSTFITSKPSVTFSSVFGTTKPTSTFSFSLSTAGTTASTTISQPQPSSIKPLASTASSAFVPTTQLGFNFSAKSSVAPTTSTTFVASTASLKTSSAFVFGTSAPVFSSISVVNSEPLNLSDPSNSLPTNLTSPHTTSVTVVASGVITTTAPIFSLFKTSEAQSTNVPSEPQTTTTFQGISSPKSVFNIPPTVPATSTVPSSPDKPVVSEANSASTDNKTSSQSTTSSSQGSFFSTVSTSPQNFLFSLGAASTKSSQNATPQPATVTVGATVPSTFSGLTITTTSSSKANGSIPQTSIFGQPAATVGTAISTGTTGSIFAAPVTVSGSLFGGPATTTTSASLFSTTAATSSIFGAASTQPAASVQSITTPIQAAPVVLTTTSTTTTSDIVFDSSVAATTATTDSVFSPSTSTISSSSSFDTTVTSTASGFGVAANTVASPVFGAPLTTSTSIFGSPGFGTTTSTAPSVFSQPTSTTPSAFAAAAAPVFGAQPKTTSAPFGSAAFSNTANTFGNAASFGNTSSASGSLFGQPAAFGGGSVFGAPVSTTANAFGSPAATSPSFSSGGSIFGAPNTPSNEFGQTQSSFSFAAAAANVPNTNSAFGFSKPAAFGFGSTATTTDASSFSFGNLNMGTATTTPNNVFNSGFAQSSNANPFAKPAAQEQKPAFGGGSLFGTPATTTASIFGGSSSGFGSSAFGSPPPPGFGSPPPPFGQQQSNFGQNSFGSSFGSPSQPGPFSGGNQSVAQTGFGAFGQTQKPTGFSAAPVFGGSSSNFGASPAFGAASPAFGAAPSFGSPNKVFGNASPTGTFGVAAQQQNPTFANLATQNTLGFGALAQQTQAAPTAAPFSGNSSFSTWR